MLAASEARHEFPLMAPTDLQQAEERSAREAASGSHDKSRYVREMFSDIAPRYDLLNHLLSFKLDLWWRRKAIRALQWEQNPSGCYLDLCAGTLDVANEIARQPGFHGRVCAADFSEEMLRVGRPKVENRPVHSMTADALALPLSDASCAGAIVAFGIRNLADLDAGLREAARVIAPGGRLVILEFSSPRYAIIRSGYNFYMHYVVPRVGGFISGNRGAYRYLPESVARFPAAAQLADRMREAGFRDVRWQLLTFGVAAIHVGTRSG
jgi:demethylmenaquinone methyltransferase/2-methoxy-6-polyprenyl-1,4-benzoquinol methylase